MRITKSETGEWLVIDENLAIELKIQATDFAEAVEKLKAFAGEVLRSRVTKADLQNLG